MRRFINVHYKCPLIGISLSMVPPSLVGEDVIGRLACTCFGFMLACLIEFYCDRVHRNSVVLCRCFRFTLHFGLHRVLCLFVQLCFATHSLHKASFLFDTSHLFGATFLDLYSFSGPLFVVVLFTVLSTVGHTLVTLYQ